MTIYKCNKCGSTDIWNGYDILLPVAKIEANTLKLEDFLDGEFNNYFYCVGCDNECLQLTVVKEETNE